MILYFSGTGNSRYAAETLARLTGDKAVNMTSLWPADGPTAMHIENNGTLGVVFPVYAWAAPTIVSETLARIAVEPGAYIYAVCTCGDDAGCAIEKLQRQIPLCAAWSLQMPNNYLPMYDVDAPALLAALDGVATLDEKSPLARWLLGAAAHYLGQGMGEGGRPRDAVARFHLGNGARVERINWLGDPSPKGLKQSHGLMVNYLYDLKRLDKHRALLAQGKIPISGAVQSLLD